MENEIIDDFEEGLNDDELRRSWFKVGIIVVIGTLLHFIMVLYKEFIPEPFMGHEIKFSLHGAMVLLVMICQALFLCDEIEIIRHERKVILNVLMVSVLIAVSEILFFLFRDVYFGNEMDYSSDLLVRYVWLIFGLMGLISNIRIRKLRNMSTKYAWWILVVTWIGIGRLLLYFNLV